MKIPLNRAKKKTPMIRSRDMDDIFVIWEYEEAFQEKSIDTLFSIKS